MTDAASSRPRTAQQKYQDANAARINERRRAVYAANKERERERRAKYYEATNARRRAHRIANATNVRAAEAAYRARNTAHISQRSAAYRAIKVDQTRTRMREYYLANRAAAFVRKARRRAAELQRLPNWRGELDELVEREARDLVMCRNTLGCSWHIDHMFPLQSRKVSGLHVWNNLQVIPAILNLQKRNKLQLTQPLEWLQHV